MAAKKGKNIVLCFDGTGNDLKKNKTNVLKLYSLLKHDPKTQIVYYDPGVGTMASESATSSLAKLYNQAIGLMFGFGVRENMKEAYTYLMENYEDGDRIFLFGFSRGAYTARAVAGMLMNLGLLDKGSHNLIPYVMRIYKNKYVLNFESFSKFFKSISRKTLDFRAIREFKVYFGRDVDIHFLGVWDTVRSFGWLSSPIYLPNTSSNPRVKAFRHALAIDERRTFYSPDRWRGKEKDDVKEVWFAGAHSDVGGGYKEEEAGLSKFALRWMIDEAKKPKYGLMIDEKKSKCVVMGTGKECDFAKPDHNAKLHKSLNTIWWLPQFFPKKYYSVSKKRMVYHFPKWDRFVEQDASLHQSVLDRIKDQPDYRPMQLNIPKMDPYPSVKDLAKKYTIVK